MFPAMRSLVIGVGNTVAAAVINSLVFGIGTAVMVKAFGVVMAPGNGLPSWLVVALVLLLTIVMWYALRPFQRLTGMVSPGRNNFADAAGALGSVSRGLGRVGGRLATTAAGVFVGERVRDKAKDDDDDDADDVRNRRRAEADPSGGSGGSGDAGADGAAGAAGAAGDGAGTEPAGSKATAGRGSGPARTDGGGRAETNSGRGTRGRFWRDQSSGSDDGPSAPPRRTGWGSDPDDELVAAEVGLPRTKAQSGDSPAVPARSSRPGRRPAPGSDASGGSGRSRPSVRRAEDLAFDDLGLDDVGVPSSRRPATGWGGPDEASDPSYVYRPTGRGGGAGA